MENFDTARMSNTSFNKIIICFLLLAVLVLQGCTQVDRMVARSKLDPLHIDHFYATRYDGEIKQKYEKILSGSKKAYFSDIDVYKAPTRRSTFRRGERICFAVHALPGDYDRKERERYRRTFGEDPWSDYVEGNGNIMILGTNIETSGGYIRSIGSHYNHGWQVTCVVSPWTAGEENPRKWRWNDTLPPGSYTATMTVKEDKPTERIHKLETSFVVK